MKATVRILRDLSSGEWICGTRWLNSYLYVYSQRISEINAEHREDAPHDNDRIESRPCQQHDHRVYEYRDRLALKPRQLTLSGAA